ncbi:MAG: RNA polymerase sigma factor [Xenococcaceae cyanobacterium]
MVCLSNSSADNSSAALEEKILLNKLAQGDRDTFWQLWELHRDYLYYLCRVWMGGNHFDAEEAVSLLSLKAWDKLPNHAQNITNLKGWLKTFTYNLCIDIHRQRKRNAVSVANVDDRPRNIQEIGISSSNHPESALLQQELKIYLRYYIEALPSRLRDPLILRYYQEMSCADIARELSISQDNVSKRLQQARQILKKHLGKYFSGLNTVAIDEAQFQQLEQKDFQLPIHIDSTVEEINYRITTSCLETLPPVWYNSPHALEWI